MTNREFFTAVIALAESTKDKTATFGNIHATIDDIKLFSADSIAKLDKRNATRSSKPSKTALENEPIKAKIVEYVEGHKQAVASEIANACDISTQKVSALCRQLVESGVLVSCDLKVPKKGKVKGYSVVVVDGEDE